MHLTQERRYRRFEIQASVNIYVSDDVTVTCQCVDFSKDGIDVKPNIGEVRFPADVLVAGHVVKVQMEEIFGTPVMDAVIIKHSPSLIGLKLLTS